MKFLIPVIMLICFISSVFASKNSLEIESQAPKNKIERKLAEAEHIYKQAINYRDGKVAGFPKDSQETHAKARDHFKLVMDKLNPSIQEEKALWLRACHNYACRHVELGNYQEAYNWFNKASSIGLTPSQENIKKLHESYAWHLVPLGDDLIIKFATYLLPKSFLQLMQTSKHLYALCNSDYFILPSSSQRLKEILINTPSSETLAFKANRTKNGFIKLAGAFIQITQEQDNLWKLGKSPKAFDKLFLLLKYFHPATLQSVLLTCEQVWKVEAEAGDKNAMLNYARLLTAQNKKIDEAVGYYNKAFINSPLGVKEAQDQLGEEMMQKHFAELEAAPLPKQLERYYQLAERRYALEEYEKAREYFEQVIKRSVKPSHFKTKASYYLSGMYYSGLGGVKDHPRARALFNYLRSDPLLSFEKRILMQFNLAEMLYLGEGGSQDPYKARQLYAFTMHSDANIPTTKAIARFRLAGMKCRGEGGSSDYSEAERLFQSVIDDPYTSKDDVALAHFNLAEMHYFGHTKQENDFILARALYASLANSIDLPEDKRSLCQYRLADMLFSGKGGDQDYLGALKLYNSLLTTPNLDDDDASKFRQKIDIIQSILNKD